MPFALNQPGTLSQPSGPSQPGTVSRINLASHHVSYYMPKEPVKLP